MRASVDERFWAKVDRRGPDECWPWTASTAGDGYGRIFIRMAQGRRKVQELAHRFAYERLVGPIPDGMTLDHLCHTQDETCAGGSGCPHRACCNPAHLEPTTLVENTLRGRSLNAQNARKTECHRGHPLDEDNTYVNPAGSRICKTCRRATDRARAGSAA